jgi:SAM-dependent methyltransferase
MAAQAAKSIVACQICGGSGSRREFTVTRDDKYMQCLPIDKRTPARYWECADCGCMLLIGGDVFDRAYSEGSYYGIEGEGPQQFLKRRFEQVMNFPPAQSDNRARVTRIQDFLTRNEMSTGERAVADIGAGMGVFLAAFKESKAFQHWKSVAIEPEPHACEHIQRMLPDTKVLKGFSDAVRHPFEYDLITFNRVLEHIFNPLPVLQSERTHLRAGGVIYLELPDAESFHADGAGNEAFGYGHHVVYSRDGFMRLAEQTGFKVEELQQIKEPSGKFTIFGFLR